MVVEHIPEIISHIEKEYNHDVILRLILTRLLDKNQEKLKNE